MVEIAATDTRLRGAMAQNPLVDGLAGTKMAQPSRLLHLFAVGVLDRLGSLLGRPPRYVPAGVAAGEFGAVANAAAFAGLDIIRPRDGSEWHNRDATVAIDVVGLSYREACARAGVRETAITSRRSMTPTSVEQAGVGVVVGGCCDVRLTRWRSRPVPAAEPLLGCARRARGRVRRGRM